MPCASLTHEPSDKLSQNDAKVVPKLCQHNASHAKVMPKLCQNTASHAKVMPKLCQNSASHAKVMPKLCQSYAKAMPTNGVERFATTSGSRRPLTQTETNGFKRLAQTVCANGLKRFGTVWVNGCAGCQTVYNSWKPFVGTTLA